MSEAKPLPIVAFIDGLGLWLVLVKSKDGPYWEEAADAEGFAVHCNSSEEADAFARSLTS